MNAKSPRRQGEQEENVFCISLAPWRLGVHQRTYSQEGATPMHRRFVPVVSAVAALLLMSSLLRAQAATQPLPPQEADVAAIKFDAKTGKPNDAFMQKHE